MMPLAASSGSAEEILQRGYNKGYNDGRRAMIHEHMNKRVTVQGMKKKFSILLDRPTY